MTVKPVRLQLSRRKGFDLQALSRATNGLEAANVTRASKQWGNPFAIGECPDAAWLKRWGWELSAEGKQLITRDARHAMLRFRQCVFWDSAMHAAIRDGLGGRNLACTCAVGGFCHGDPLLWIANMPAEEIEALQYEIDQALISEAEAMLKADGIVEG